MKYGDGTTSVQLTAADKRKLKDKLNRIFVKNIVDRGAVAIPVEFSTGANYTTVTSLNSNTTEASWQGILTPTKDTNGLLKKRYNMVRNYYIQNYNIDLQQIGNNLNN